MHFDLISLHKPAGQDRLWYCYGQNIKARRKGDRLIVTYTSLKTYTESVSVKKKSTKNAKR